MSVNHERELLAAIDPREVRRFYAENRQLRDIERNLGDQLYYQRATKNGMVQIEDIRNHYDLLRVQVYD